jgi:hypothetical protein
LLHDSNDMDDVKLEGTPPREPSFNGDNVPTRRENVRWMSKTRKLSSIQLKHPANVVVDLIPRAWILVTRLQSLATKRENVFST